VSEANVPHAPFRPRVARGRLRRILPHSVRAGDCRRRFGERSRASAHYQESAPDRPLPQLEITSPVAPVNPFYSFVLSKTHANTRGSFGDGGQLSFAAEVQHFSGQHGAPSIDAIGHIGRDGKLFGGVDAAAATSNLDGIGASGVGANLSIDTFPTDLLVNRGILLDVARFVNGDSRPLDSHAEVTADLLERTAKHQHVTLKKGDTVFIRTGYGPLFQVQSQRLCGSRTLRPDPASVAPNS